MKSSRLLPWFRSWSRRVPILHGILIAQLIMLPSSTSRGVWVDVDSDGDGIFDTGYDDGTSPPDTTPPPEPDPILDSDGDNLSDADEAAAGSNPYSPDSDGDGVTDADEINLTGTDPNSSDSDGDGISDYNEFYGNTAVDEDTSGPGETPYDYDGDGIADPVDPDPLSPQNDPDSDGDYVPDSQDSDPYNPAVWNDANGNGINDDAEVPNNDTDGDGVSNDTDSHPADPWLNNDWNYNGQNDGDEDADGDGVSNLQDSHPNSNCLWCDWNGNGVNDDVEAGTADNDGDGVADNADSHPFNNGLWEDWNSNGMNDSVESVNSDGDARPDYSDSDPQDFNLWEDWNRNGINDNAETPPNPDRDNDLMPNENDSDPDNGALWCDWNRNGINDTEEPPPLDQDNDGHPDSNDSDPGNNNLWEDWNHNGYNDSTEGQYLDDDSDSHPNAFDTHPQDGLLWSDHNGNGINDESETTITDTDGDGYNDDLDTHPDDPQRWNDHDDNGINDELELPPDRDGDSIADDQDEFPDDFDNDGLADAEEISRGSNPSSPDTDGDGLTDFEEDYADTNLFHVDTDGDGLTDFEELRAYQTDPLAPTAISSSPPPDPVSTSGTSSPPSPEPTPVAALKNYYKLKTASIWSLTANMADDDGDGIPNAVEELYAPLVITPGGDLDGDLVSNIKEYEAGTDLNGAKAGDFDGDGISDLNEEIWPAVLSKFRFGDAYEDPDADGLLNIEEVNCSHGGRLKVTGMVATNPRQQCSGPSSSALAATYNVAIRTKPLPVVFSLISLYQNWSTTGIPSGFWFYRDSVYSAWMTDGSLRQSIRDRLSIGPSLPADFFTQDLRFRPPFSADIKTVANYGYDHLPRGYVRWLQAKGLVLPPLGGRGPLNYHPELIGTPRWTVGSSGLLVQDWVYAWQHVAEHPDPLPSGILASLDASVRNPAPADIDGDGMPNYWEARYDLNFRSGLDADIIIQAETGATDEQKALASAQQARFKDEFNLIREYPATYAPGGVFTKTEWDRLKAVDPDHDGLPNLLEFKLDSNPRIPDFAETLTRDTDHDGYSDTEELLLGTNYLDASSNPSTLPGGIGGPVTPPGGGTPPPNDPIMLIWNAPTVRAGHGTAYKSDGGILETQTGGERTYYASGSRFAVTDDYGMIGQTEPKNIGEIIPTCSLPSATDAHEQWDRVSTLGMLFQSHFVVANRYNSNSVVGLYRDQQSKSWSHTRAQIKAVNPTLPLPLHPAPVTLQQPVKVTCLRIKERYSGADKPPTSINLLSTEVLGTYTFTIPAGDFKSEVFPTMLSFPFLHPADSNTPGGVEYKLLPIEVRQTQLASDGYSVQGGLTQASTFRLARWQDAWDASWNTKSDFIASDRDRVQIRMASTAFPNLSSGSKPVVKIECGIDAANTIDTTKLEMNLNGGFYESEPFLLVADADDDLSYNGKAGMGETKDGELNDQTLRAGQGHTIYVTFENTGSQSLPRIEIGKTRAPVHTLQCELVYVSEDGSVPAQVKSDIEYWLQEASETFAQIGITLSRKGEVKGTQAPQEYWQAIEQDQLTYQTSRIVAGQEEWFSGWIRNQQPSVGDFVKVFFVPVSIWRNVPGVSGPINVAGLREFKWALVCTEQNNTQALILAHEVAHFAGQNDHTEGNRNLMRAHTPEVRTFDYLDKKRFQSVDEQKIKDHLSGGN